MLRLSALVALALGLCLPFATSWLLEGLVASWVVPDADGTHGENARPAQRTQPLKVNEHDDEPQDFAPLNWHSATPPPSRRQRRTSRAEDTDATPTVRNIETTSQLYQLFKDRRRTSASAERDARFVQQPNPPACMQRFICEVHMQQDQQLQSAGDVERNVVNTLRKFQLQSPDSEVYQYTYAAHMGRLLRDSAPSGCHALFSSCPFSKDDMLLLMASLSRSTSLSIA